MRDLYGEVGYTIIDDVSDASHGRTAVILTELQISHGEK